MAALTPGNSAWARVRRRGVALMAWLAPDLSGEEITAPRTIHQASR